MSHDATRLNIERAREALARAGKDQAVAAVRSPRPADLSRLQEEEARKQSIDARASVFRDQVRERLGLGEYRGPASPASSYMAGVMSAPLCDADICAPVRPATVRTRDGAPYSPVEFDEGDALSKRAEAAAPKKRKKFLGIF